METHHSTPKVTYADFLLFPDDGRRHELLDGEHVVTASPVPKHQRICTRLLYLLEQHLETHPVGVLYGGPVDLLLSDVDVAAPDIVFVSNERALIVGEKNLQGAPDLVVEVLSPGTKRRDLGVKRDLYERSGVGEYWVVDPVAQTVAVYCRIGGRFREPRLYATTALIASAIFPGLELSAIHIFG